MNATIRINHRNGHVSEQDVTEFVKDAPNLSLTGRTARAVLRDGPDSTVITGTVHHDGTDLSIDAPGREWLLISESFNNLTAHGLSLVRID